MKDLRENFDKLAEIHPFVGDIVKDGLYLVTLIFDIAYLHVEIHLGGYLPRLYHRTMLESDGLLPLLDVIRLGLAVNLLELAVLRIEAHAAHLPGHHIARQGDDADIMPRSGLYGHDVALLQRETVDILVVSSAGILESHLVYVAGQRVGVIFQPVGHMQFEAALAYASGELLASTAAKFAAPAHIERTVLFIFLILKQFHLSFRICQTYEKRIYG